MTEQPTGILWDVLRFAYEKNFKKFLEKAREAKRENYETMLDLQRENAIIDNLVAKLMPDEEWMQGWWDGSSPVVRPRYIQQNKPTPAQRAQRVIAIANGLVRGGAQTVTTSKIAETLQAEGYEGQARDLAVSIGNTLAREGSWKRVKPGEYAPIEE